VSKQSSLEVVYVEPSELHPNSWNPNEMDGPTMERLKREVERVGMVVPVAALPDGTIIDGEHRWRVAQDKGVKVPVVYIDTDEQTAKTLCVNMNAIRGKDDPARLVALVESLGMGTEEMERVLGITESKMDELRAALDAPDIQLLDEDIGTKHECPECGYKWS
jgi:ParB-like chromosome segregation protein Spo0J